MAKNKDIEKVEDSVVEAQEEEVAKEEEVAVLSLDSIKKAGGLLERKPVKKRITWTRPEDDTSVQFDVFVRLQSFKTFSVFVEDREKVKDKSSVALMISRCIARDNNGLFDLFTYEQACDLDYTLALTLAEAIHEVNNKKK